MSVTAPGGTFEVAGQTVARIGFGAMQLPGVGDRPAPPREVAISVLRRAVELGVNHIDTAQFYGDGVANELIREALAPYPEPLVLVSKVGAAPGPDGGLVAAQRPEQLRAALPVGITCVQNAYSLIQREDEPLLELCREQGIAWVPFFPLGSAFSWMPKVTDHAAVLAAAAALGVTPAQIGLAWLLAHAPNTLLIPGTADPAHLADNVAAGSVTLDADTLAALEA